MYLAAEHNDPIMEMNTTPLIDVMLVLLIMFIITIPIQTHAVKIDLPTGIIDPPIFDPIKNKLVIDQRGTIFWNGRPTDLQSLAAVLEQTQALPVVPELHLQPDPLAPYERIDNVLAVTKRAGVEAMGFVGNERYRSF